MVGTVSRAAVSRETALSRVACPTLTATASNAVAARRRLCFLGKMRPYLRGRHRCMHKRPARGDPFETAAAWVSSSTVCTTTTTTRSVVVL